MIYKINIFCIFSILFIFSHMYIIQMIYKINIFCIFSVLFIFSHMYFLLMRIGFQWCISTNKKCWRVQVEKTYIGIYFSDQIWMVDQFEVQLLDDQKWVLGLMTLKSNYYQTLIDFKLYIYFWFNTLYIITFIFTNLDFIHTNGFSNENNHSWFFERKQSLRVLRFCWSL